MLKIHVNHAIVQILRNDINVSLVINTYIRVHTFLFPLSNINFVIFDKVHPQ